MEGLDFWRLCDEVSVIQAALLVVGVDPAGTQEYVLDWEPHNRPKGFDAAFAAITHAILAERLPATIVRGFSKREILTQIIDWNATTISVENLRTWLRGRGIKTGFFFPKGADSEDYLTPTHPHYSPKLAAAIGAWEAVSSDRSTLRGRTVKQALAVWLRRNSDMYGLTKDDGNPNEQGIEEVSKIANWDTKGGAPKTPGE